MTDQLPSKEKAVLNHEEAYELACYKRENSNLARCYIDLREDLYRTESARVAILAENTHYKQRVAELEGELAIWRQCHSAPKPAHEREPPHCSTCGCGLAPPPGDGP